LGRKEDGDEEVRMEARWSPDPSLEDSPHLDVSRPVVIDELDLDGRAQHLALDHGIDDDATPGTGG
jgi:hypothetical protein